MTKQLYFWQALLRHLHTQLVRELSAKPLDDEDLIPYHESFEFTAPTDHEVCA